MTSANSSLTAFTAPRGLPRVAFAALFLPAACSTSYNPGGTGAAPVVDPLPNTAITDGTVGSSCGTCAAGLSCFTALPSGYCTKSCVDSSECGENARCSALTTGEMLCLRTCTKDNQCRVAYSCQGAVGSTVCYGKGY